jgi:hypothetical protein
MNPKHSPALSTVPECTLTAGAMSIKQQEQQFMYAALQKVNNKF